MMARRLPLAVWALLAVGLSAQDAPRRRQEPIPPYPYKSVEVTFAAPDGATIAGTLTAPSSGAHPGVLLLPGSGPNDRDAAMAGHKPFLVLADHLTRHGFTVLRTDSRGVGKSSGNYYDATGETLAADAAAGVNFLRARPEVNARRVGLVGHSLGALVAALAAARPGAADWVVLLSSPARPDIENSTDRVVAQLTARNAPRPEIDRVVALLRKVTTSPEAPDSRAGVRELTALIAGDAIPAAQMDAVVDLQMTSMRSPWGRYFATLDPRPVFRSLKCPVLAIGGSLDQALPPRENLQQLHESLRAAGNEQATVIELFGLNHLLQTARTGAVTEIAQIDETISPRALSILTAWLRERAEAGAR